jgi:hypothetical protein
VEDASELKASLDKLDKIKLRNQKKAHRKPISSSSAADETSK